RLARAQRREVEMLLDLPDVRIGVADERSASMTRRAILAATSVAVVWGLTFIAIKIGVRETSPLMLSALGFAFAAFPAVFLVAPPKAPARKIALYGLSARRRAVRPIVHCDLRG